jgi:hypothetical protein
MAASGAETASFTPFLRLSGAQSSCTNPQELVQPIAKCGLPVPYPQIWGQTGLVATSGGLQDLHSSDLLRNPGEYVKLTRNADEGMLALSF